MNHTKGLIYPVFVFKGHIQRIFKHPKFCSTNLTFWYKREILLFDLIGPIYPHLRRGVILKWLKSARLGPYVMESFYIVKLITDGHNIRNRFHNRRCAWRVCFCPRQFAFNNETPKKSFGTDSLYYCRKQLLILKMSKPLHWSRVPL